MERDAFVQGLADELLNLPAGGLLVISEPGEPKRSRYTQFAQMTDELFAYVVVNSFLDEQVRASQEGERVIAEAGWRPPELKRGHDNWWTELPWPATAQQYLDVARMVAVGLRDGYGIADRKVTGRRHPIRWHSVVLSTAAAPGRQMDGRYRSTASIDPPPRQFGPSPRSAGGRNDGGGPCGRP